MVYYNLRFKLKYFGNEKTAEVYDQYNISGNILFTSEKKYRRRDKGYSIYY